MENKSELIKDLIEFNKEIGAIKKEQQNPFFNSKYADLNTYIEASRPIMCKHGLVVTQTVDFNEFGPFLVTTLWHESGSNIDSKYPIKPLKEDPQAYGSALTYARRYAYASILCLSAEDDDGNRASEPRANNNQSNGYSNSNPNQDLQKCPKCGDQKVMKSKPGFKSDYWCLSCKTPFTNAEINIGTLNVPKDDSQNAPDPQDDYPFPNDPPF